MWHAAAARQFAEIFEIAVRDRKSGQLPNMWRLFGMSATSACADNGALSVEHSKVYFGCDFVQSRRLVLFVTPLTNMKDGDEFSRSPWPLLLSVLSLHTK